MPEQLEKKSNVSNNSSGAISFGSSPDKQALSSSLQRNRQRSEQNIRTPSQSNSQDFDSGGRSRSLQGQEVQEPLRSVGSYELNSAQNVSTSWRRRRAARKEGLPPLKDNRNARGHSNDENNATSQPLDVSRTLSSSPGGRRSFRRLPSDVSLPAAGEKLSAESTGHGLVQSENLGSVYFAGEIVGGSGFARRPTYAQWYVDLEDQWGWLHVAGLRQGITQSSCPFDYEDDLCLWDHPLNLQLKTSTFQRWPKIYAKVYQGQGHKQSENFLGYASCFLPTSPGYHEFSTRIWRPNDKDKLRSEEYEGFWTGVNPHCTEAVESDLKLCSNGDIDRLFQCGAGRLYFRMFAVFKDMDKVKLSDVPEDLVRRHKGSAHRGSPSADEGDFSLGKLQIRESRASRLGSFAREGSGDLTHPRARSLQASRDFSESDLGNRSRQLSRDGSASPTRRRSRARMSYLGNSADLGTPSEVSTNLHHSRDALEMSGGLQSPERLRDRFTHRRRRRQPSIAENP